MIVNDSRLAILLLRYARYYEFIERVIVRAQVAQSISKAIQVGLQKEICTMKYKF